jgi:hypothetical protein
MDSRDSAEVGTPADSSRSPKDSDGPVAKEVPKGVRLFFSSPWTVTIAGGLIAAIASALIIPRLLASPSHSAAKSSVGIPAGYYVDNRPGTPHWFIHLDTGPGDEISGTIAFVGQDGQTGLSQAFSGQLKDGLGTLLLSKAGVQTASIGTNPHVPTLYLGACTKYLKFITSLAQCAFTHAADIQGDQKNPTS